MADIELVIKISEEEYINIKNAINNLIENGIERTSMSKVCLAILDGTPLSKGHGDLKDMEDIYRALEGWEDDTAWIVDAIDCYAPTIIEADKEEGAE